MIDVSLHIPPFNVRVRSDCPDVARYLELFYAKAPRLSQDDLVDFDIGIRSGRMPWRRWWRPQARFLLDGHEPFFPLPALEAGPLLEWGLNWCVAQRPLGYLAIHGAVVANASQQAIVLPGFPGAGKSTLCAALVFLRGWRLLSDELTLLDLTSGLVQPHPRPISLKNQSIEVVRRFGNTQLGPVVRATRKGDIAHAVCPSEAVAKAGEQARVHWILFPRFVAGATPHQEEISRAEAFVRVSEQSFNHERLGEAGFEAMCTLLQGARCFELMYGSTDDALELVRRLVEGTSVGA